MAPANWSEFEWIETCLRPLVLETPEALGLADDAALVSFAAEHEMVVSTDALVGEVHFLEKASPEDVASKALRASLSDLAAMGATPRGFLLSLMRPSEISDQWLQRFSAQLGHEQRIFSCPLLGGDTTATKGPLTLAITVIGEVPKGQALKREGAKVGDQIYVSGTIGDAAIGLELLLGKRAPNEDQNYFLKRHYRPEPRIVLGRAVRNIVSSAMDLSDGLFGDLCHILKASKVSARIDTEKVPFSKAAQKLFNGEDDVLLTTLLTGGEDYELIMTVPPEKEHALVKISHDVQVPLRRIGEIISEAKPTLQVYRGEQLLQVTCRGFTHF